MTPNTILRQCIHEVCHDMDMDDGSAIEALTHLNNALWYLTHPWEYGSERS